MVVGAIGIRTCPGLCVPRPTKNSVLFHSSRSNAGRQLGLVIGAYLMEWTFRQGYLEFKFLRTINLRFLVPWYDVVPQIGVILFAAGWWSAKRPAATKGNLFPETGDAHDLERCSRHACSLS